MKNNLIHFIITGGTIDSSWDSKQDSMVLNEKSDVPIYFEKFNILDEVLFTQICLKDSRELIGQDLENILKNIEGSKATKIIITHGSFTASDTCKYLKKNLKRKDQTIILTSGTVPLTGFGMSDSPFNLGYAIAKVQDLPPGIYISIKGKVFSIEEFDKFAAGGKLYEIYGAKK